MAEKKDWRLRNQEKYLSGVVLHWESYSKFHKDTDHDHCSFCWDEFMENEKFLREGYTTEDHYHWICKKCYEDFKEMFKWRVAES